MMFTFPNTYREEFLSSGTLVMPANRPYLDVTIVGCGGGGGGSGPSSDLAGAPADNRGGVSGGAGAQIFVFKTRITGNTSVTIGAGGAGGFRGGGNGS